MRTREERLAVGRNYKANLRSTAQKEHDRLRGCLLELPSHPTKPSLEQLEEWIHDAVCNICGKTKQENGKEFALDHNHATGEFRGFLCIKCNMLLGYASDQVEVLRKAIAYLEEPPARNFL